MTRIGDYEVRRRIGEGGMGVVYEAVEELSGRKVALKVLNAELMDRADVRARFFNEMRILASLEHPNIVRSLASRDIDGQLVMVLELLEGRTLREELEASGRLPVARAIAIGSAVASALVAAHSKDPPIVHRDLKPENLMLVGASGVKVMDFGVAKVVADGPKATTQVVGTVQYMSPEQAQGGAITPKTDLYALGLVLYEMLAGNAPFQSASLLVLIRQQCDAAPPPFPQDVRAEIPRELEALVFELLAKAPDDRPADARAVLEVLESLVPHAPPRSSRLEAEPAPAPPSVPVSKRAATSPRVVKRVDTIALLNRFERRTRWPYFAAGTAVSAAAVVAGVVVFNSRTGPAASASVAPSASAPSASAAPTASAKAPRACDRGDACVVFAPPDRARVDGTILFEESAKQARAVDPEARLGGAILQNVLAGGAIDLTRPDALVTLTYDLPQGAVRVDVSNGLMVITRVTTEYMQDVAPDEPCPLSRAVEVATNAGRLTVTPATDATLTVGSVAGKSSWVFRSGEEAAIVEGPDCVLKSRVGGG
ncbi:MAG: serine/threonine protein kinase [Polyangiaceae bacterium]|nr:serine/threonine protein kinase [Polyangiaceae bacterium]